MRVQFKRNNLGEDRFKNLNKAALTGHVAMELSNTTTRKKGGAARLFQVPN